MKEKILGFLKSIPKPVYIIFIILLSFLIMLKYEQYKEDNKIKQAEIKQEITKQADEAYIKSKEKIPVEDTPISFGTGFVQKKAVSIQELSKLNAITSKFQRPIIFGGGDFNKSASGIITLNEGGAVKLGIRYDGELIKYINNFLNNNIGETNTIEIKGFKFIFDKNFIIKSAYTPGLQEGDKDTYNKLTELYNQMVNAYVSKKDYISGNITIKNSDLNDKIIEVKKSISEFQTKTSSLPNDIYNGKNAIEVISLLKIN